MSLHEKDLQAKEPQPKRQCPKCKSGTLDERIPRSQFVRYFLFWLPLQRYLCFRCGKASYIFR